MKAQLAFSLAVGLTAVAGQQTFRVNVDGVRVDVLVMDGDRAVSGLTAKDFELRDTGVVQHVESVAFEIVPLSVMLALDASGSVDGPPLASLKRAAAAVIARLETGDRAALLTFSEAVELAADWTLDTHRVTRAIDTTRASGKTALHDAAYAALAWKDPAAGRALVLIFSDGDDTASWLPGQTVIDVARRSDAVVYGVAIQPRLERKAGYLMDFRSGLQPQVQSLVPSAVTKSLLMALTEDTGGKFIEAVHEDRLIETFTHIINEFRMRYLLTYTPAGVDRTGWHPIDVKVKNRRFDVTARRGYLR